MLKRTIVFGGISISAKEVNRYLLATVEGPIRRGDLRMAQDFQIIVILDGEFGQSLSVSPKEIIEALTRDVCVIGASSMGALRASELDSFGMLGVGWVYRRFASAKVRRDDEVALSFDPVTGSALTLPMVNILYWVETLLSRGTVTTREASYIRRVGNRIFFAARYGDTFITQLQLTFGASRVQSFLEVTNGVIPDIKSLDAVAALRCALENGADSAVEMLGERDVRGN